MEEAVESFRRQHQVCFVNRRWPRAAPPLLNRLLIAAEASEGDTETISVVDAPVAASSWCGPTIGCSNRDVTEWLSTRSVALLLGVSGGLQFGTKTRNARAFEGP